MGSSSPGSWQRLAIVLDGSEVEIAENMLRVAGAVALSVRDAGDAPVLEPAPGVTPVWPRAVLSALFPATSVLEPIAAALEARFGPATAATVERLEPEQYEPDPVTLEAPLPIGRKLLIGTPGTHPEAHRVLLELNRGLAFGTGTHPTTALCLEWLERELEPGDRVLDYGCGSGILALAALKLDAARAWAVDIEPQALAATRENARLNGLEARLWIGPPDALGRIEVDLIVANLLAAPLIRLVETFATLLRPGGVLVMSGILTEQCATLEAAYGAVAEHFESGQRGGWARLSARRRTGAV